MNLGSAESACLKNVTPNHRVVQSVVIVSEVVAVEGQTKSFWGPKNSSLQDAWMGKYNQASECVLKLVGEQFGDLSSVCILGTMVLNPLLCRYLKWSEATMTHSLSSFRITWTTLKNMQRSQKKQAFSHNL